MVWIRWVVIAAVVLVAWTLYAQLSSKQSAEAHRLVSQGAVLLDVRTREEFTAGHLPGAINIPVQDLTQRMAEVGPDKKKPVVVYCRSGNRSARAKRMLTEAGYQQVFDLGAMSNW
ncbi:MAG: rhodanese-like domain-containing protein [Myxococcota bacterium]